LNDRRAEEIWLFCKPQSFCANLLTLVSDDALRNKLSSGGCKNVKGFIHYTALLNNMKVLYNKLLLQKQTIIKVFLITLVYYLNRTMKKSFKSSLKLLVVAVILSSCHSINPSVMFKTGKDFKYSEQPKEVLKEYKIAANDLLEFKLYTNDGFKLIDITSLNSEGQISSGAVYSYKVEFDGTVKLPIVNRIKLEGMTIREAELLLEDTYSKEYIKPFVLLSISNRRVIIFPGFGGSAKVITLINDNTTLIEALAIAGGITQRGKAQKVKLLRGNLKNPEVFLIDLSTIDGIKQADLVMQANDIIYVEPSADIATGLANQVAPYISLITSVVFIYTYITLFK